ncbi:P2 [Paper mulberry vein-banding virus]|nr:P2 [Paper mulberry vein-banding virus]
MSIIISEDYREAVAATESFSEPGKGLIKAVEEIKSNQNQTRQLNTVIALLTSLHKKVDELTQRIEVLEARKAPEIDKSLEELTTQIQNLKVEGSESVLKGPKVAQRTYYFDNPKAILKREKTQP